jgi:hypothetical protein
MIGTSILRPEWFRWRGAVLVAFAGVAFVLGGCGAVGGRGDQLAVDRIVAGTPDGTGCSTTVHGVVPGPGSLKAAWLPTNFQLTDGGLSDLSSVPVATYASAKTGDPPRIELSHSNSSVPLNPADGGRATATALAVQGHSALLETGPPSPQFIGVYWKPTSHDLLSVVGYKVPASIVIRVARQISFRHPGSVSLPVTPGTITSKSSAIAAARRRFHRSVSNAKAKLTSWTEVTTMLGTSHKSVNASTVPSNLMATPWEPIWIVLASLKEPGSGSGAAAKEIVVIDAASGRIDLTTPTGSDSSWFAALTDRNPKLSGCAGGSRVRLPFGVLTRVEENRVARTLTPPGVAGSSTSAIVKLSTVRALNRADPSLYGGCVQVDCSLNELVWPTIAVIRSRPEGTLACLPPWASYPPGYQPKQVRQYVTVGVSGSTEINCGSVPKWVNRLKDLAPPAAG